MQLHARESGCKHQRSRFLLYRDLQSTSTKEWLVRELLGDGDASAVYGKPGAGKSVLVEDMALHVAAGRDWHGKKVKQGTVLYIALERTKVVERRAIAFRNTHELNNLPFAIMGGVYDFRDPRTAETIVQTSREVVEATKTPLRLICIDTLSRALCGGDENASKDMGAIVTSTALIQQRTGAHVCWLHHMPVETERMRGHGSLLGAMDTTILVAKTGNLRTATVVKANDSEEGVQIVFSLESVTVGTDADGNPTTAPIVRQAERIDCRTRWPQADQKSANNVFAAARSRGSRAHNRAVEPKSANSRHRHQAEGETCTTSEPL